MYLKHSLFSLLFSEAKKMQSIFINICAIEVMYVEQDMK